jgi:hypothetical protein
MIVARIKSRAIFVLFILLSAFWALVVLNATARWDETWKAWGLALVGVICISGVGIRLYTIFDTKLAIAALNRQPKRMVVTGNDPLEPCQVGYREPYIDRRGR